MVSKSSWRPAQPLLSPVQGRPRGKHKATNPQAVELAGMQILLLLLQACAGVIANQNLPWLQTRSLNANAMVKKKGRPPRGRWRQDSASPDRPNCGNRGFRQSVPLNLCVASSFPTKGSRFKDEKERQSSDDRRVLSLKYPVFLSCCFTSPQPSSKRTQASGASISTGQNQPQKAPLHARLQHYLMLMLMNK